LRARSIALRRNSGGCGAGIYGLLSCSDHRYKSGVRATGSGSIREQAGLHQADTATSSITDWRIRHTRDTQGYDAALKLSGRSRTCLNDRLKHRNPSPQPDENQTAKCGKSQMLEI
jgi:hypothetical protein